MGSMRRRVAPVLALLLALAAPSLAEPIEIPDESGEAKGFVTEIVMEYGPGDEAAVHNPALLGAFPITLVPRQGAIQWSARVTFTAAAAEGLFFTHGDGLDWMPMGEERTVTLQRGEVLAFDSGASDGEEWVIQVSATAPLTFAYSTGFDVPASVVGMAIGEVDVLEGVSGGLRPYVFRAAGLPAGIEIDPISGRISGAPASDGPAGTAEVFVTDNAGDGETKSITVYYGAVLPASVGAAPVIATPPVLPPGAVDIWYSYTLAAVSDTPVRWSVDGELPQRLALDPDTGTISGDPAQAETATFFVTAVNDVGRATAALTLIIGDTLESAPVPQFLATASPAPTSARGYEQARIGNCNEWVNMRSGPGTNFEVVGKALLGESLEVLEWSDGGTWCKAAFDGGSRTGWIHGRFIVPMR